MLNGFGSRIPPLLKRLGCPPESICELLDFYHAAEHLQQFAEAAFTEPTLAQTWFKQARSVMKRGQVGDLIDKMQAMVKKSSGDRRKAMAGQLAYFTTAQRTAAPKLRKGGSHETADWPRAVESLIRQVVNLRAHWHGQVLAVAECRNHVAREMPVGSGCMGMGKFLRLDPDSYALSGLITRCVELCLVTRAPSNFPTPQNRVAPLSGHRVWGYRGT